MIIKNNLRGEIKRIPTEGVISFIADAIERYNKNLKAAEQSAKRVFTLDRDAYQFGAELYYTPGYTLEDFNAAIAKCIEVGALTAEDIKKSGIFASYMDKNLFEYSPSYENGEKVLNIDPELNSITAGYNYARREVLTNKRVALLSFGGRLRDAEFDIDKIVAFIDACAYGKFTTADMIKKSGLFIFDDGNQDDINFELLANAVNDNSLIKCIIDGYNIDKYGKYEKLGRDLRSIGWSMDDFIAKLDTLMSIKRKEENNIMKRIDSDEWFSGIKFDKRPSYKTIFEVLMDREHLLPHVIEGYNVGNENVKKKRNEKLFTLGRMLCANGYSLENFIDSVKTCIDYFDRKVEEIERDELFSEYNLDQDTLFAISRIVREKETGNDITNGYEVERCSILTKLGMDLFNKGYSMNAFSNDIKYFRNGGFVTAEDIMNSHVFDWIMDLGCSASFQTIADIANYDYLFTYIWYGYNAMLLNAKTMSSEDRSQRGF